MQPDLPAFLGRRVIKSVNDYLSKLILPQSTNCLMRISDRVIEAVAVVKASNCLSRSLSVCASSKSPSAKARMLMLHWLSELNYRRITEHRLFRQFEVIQMDEESLVAVVRGEKLDPARHEIFTEIKAVTFHAMRIERSDRGWEAQIIFDL
jgi:Archease protein family (MTH1598/TM1083)